MRLPQATIAALLATWLVAGCSSTASSQPAPTVTPTVTETAVPTAEPTQKVMPETTPDIREKQAEEAEDLGKGLSRATKRQIFLEAVREAYPDSFGLVAAPELVDLATVICGAFDADVDFRSVIESSTEGTPFSDRQMRDFVGYGTASFCPRHIILIP